MQIYIVKLLFLFQLHHRWKNKLKDVLKKKILTIKKMAVSIDLPFEILLFTLMEQKCIKFNGSKSKRLLEKFQ